MCVCVYVCMCVKYVSAPDAMSARQVRRKFGSTRLIQIAQIVPDQGAPPQVLGSLLTKVLPIMVATLGPEIDRTARLTRGNSIIAWRLEFRPDHYPFVRF